MRAALTAPPAPWLCITRSVGRRSRLSVQSGAVGPDLTAPPSTGPLALVGGDEFHQGNEEQDRRLVAAAVGRPAYVVCAAVRQPPAAAATAATARRWFANLGCDMSELRVRSRSDAMSADIVQSARGAGLVYVAGGDPGRTVALLAASPVWSAIVEAWLGGAALAGSSAGAMALCQWTLVRDRWPAHETRRPRAALGLVSGCAVLPHFDTFGRRWIPSARATLGTDTTLVGVDERSAAFWDGVRWTALGAGRVILVSSRDTREFTGSSEIQGLPAPVSP
jgi:cyanophycinase